ncbi:MAG: hypothetical protein R3253_16680, partial [Longimicrobiales bacterium]|nr:hypothetical protein [Longimicrobiales bacterium]
MAKSKTKSKSKKKTKSKSKAKSKAKKKTTKASKSKKKESKGPAVADLRDGADRARGWLAEREDYYGYLARRKTGRGAPELASHLRGDLMARQQADGFWAELETGEPDFQLTVASLWQLMELGMERGMRAVEDGVTWILGTRGREGAFGEGTALDHTIGSAPGVAGGFFSPADPEYALEIALSNG